MTRVGRASSLAGYEGKRIYVWFDAVKGYLSAAMEWAMLKGEPDAWKEWWLQEEGEPVPASRTISSARTTSPSTLLSGPPC